MLPPDVPLRDAAVEHLVEVIGIGVHEDGLTRAAGGEIRHGGFRGHVFQRVHADAQVRQERFRQNLAQLIVDGGGDRRRAIVAAITTECSKESTVRGTRVQAVQTIDDVEPLFKRLQRCDRLWQFGLSQRAAVLHARRDAGAGFKALVFAKRK